MEPLLGVGTKVMQTIKPNSLNPFFTAKDAEFRRGLKAIFNRFQRRPHFWFPNLLWLKTVLNAFPLRSSAPSAVKLPRYSAFPWRSLSLPWRLTSAFPNPQLYKIYEN